MASSFRTLGRFLEETRFQNLPQSVQSRAKLLLLDTLGAILGGMRFKEIGKLSESTKKMSHSGPSTIFGGKKKVQPLFAALVHGCAGTWLELDEGNSFTKGHPGIHVVPAVAAMSEARGASGKDLLVSLVLGYEIAARIGEASELRPGVHPHGTWGTVGAAVAGGKIIGLKAEDFLSIIHLSSTLSVSSSLQSALEGATIRNAYAGLSGFLGLMALEFYRAGFTAEKNGLASIYGRILSGSFDQGKFLRGLGTSYAIERNYFKMHACCRYNHSTLDALAAIQKKEPFKYSEVERIEVHTYDRALWLKDPCPSNMLAAKFSVPYAAAAYLVMGDTWTDSFEGSAIKNTRIRSLAQKVQLMENKKFTAMLHDKKPARVVVFLKGGKILEETVFNCLGDPELPHPISKIEDKFLRLSKRVMGRERSMEVIKTIQNLDDLPNVNHLVKLLRGPKERSKD